jgi:hypothetical protein
MNQKNIRLEEHFDGQLIDKIRSAVIKCLDDCDVKESNRRDRWLVQFTEEICMSKM